MPVTVSIADFRARFPEFNTTLDAVVQDALEEALLIHSVRKLATLYCAAHLLSVPGAGAGAQGGGMGQIVVHGEVSTKQVGPLSTTFTTQDSNATTSTTQDNTAFFSRTEYGRHFLTLEHRAARTAIGATIAR